MSERPRDLTEAVAGLLSNGPFVLGVDFDGTLAPLVDHPDDAVPDQQALSLLRELAARPNLDVAIVSGRGLTDLKARLGDVPGAEFVGEHGNDVDGAVGETDSVLDEAISLIDSLAKRFPEATVEQKRQSVTFHTRSIDETGKQHVDEVIRGWTRGREGIRVIDGKEVYELTTATGNKGDAMRHLARGRPLIYIGDDTTDETVFETLRPGDVGVKVGEGDTAAPYRVKDVAGVVAILEQIALASG